MTKALFRCILSFPVSLAEGEGFDPPEPGGGALQFGLLRVFEL